MGGLQAGAERHSGDVSDTGIRSVANPSELMLEQFRPLIEAALDHTNGAQTWDMLAEEVREGRAFLMISPSGQSVSVLQPVHDLHVWTASGNMEELMMMEAGATERAINAGFDRMTLKGRDGWERTLRTRGWKPYTGLVKEL